MSKVGMAFWDSPLTLTDGATTWRVHQRPTSQLTGTKGTKTTTSLHQPYVEKVIVPSRPSGATTQPCRTEVRTGNASENADR